MEKITKAKAEEYFGSVNDAISFYEKSQQIQMDELLEARVWKRYDIFQNRPMQFATNNAGLSNLMNKFQLDYLEVIENQIKERAQMISNLKDLL